jgi:hypothetical protein
MSLIIPRAPTLAYPAGFAPGVDPAHPISKNAVLSWVASLPLQNLVGGAQGSYADAYSYPAVDGVIGPSISVNDGGGKTGGITFSLAGKFAPITMAFIGVVNNKSYAFGSMNGVSAKGASYSTSLGFGIGTNVSFNSNAGYAGYSPPEIAPVGHPFFYAVSYKDSTTVYLVFVDLTTGQIYSEQGTTNGPGTGYSFTSVNVGSGGNYGSNLDQSRISCAMLSQSYTPTDQLLNWAQDPWAFWYPRPKYKTFSVGALVSGFTLTAADGVFTETGEPATFNLKEVTSFGNFTETGEAAPLSPVLNTAYGAFVETGATASFLDTLSVSFGSFAETGNSASFDDILGTVYGTFTETGEPGTLSLGTVMPATYATFSMTGEAATFNDKIIVADGAFSETGHPATLTWSGASIVTTYSPATLTPYVPGVYPQIEGGQPRYIVTELRKIASAISSMRETLIKGP